MAVYYERVSVIGDARHVDALERSAVALPGDGESGSGAGDGLDTAVDDDIDAVPVELGVHQGTELRIER